MVKIHAILGGRNPHPNFAIGGVPATSDRMRAVTSGSGWPQQGTQVDRRYTRRDATFRERGASARHEGHRQFLSRVVYPWRRTGQFPDFRRTTPGQHEKSGTRHSQRRYRMARDSNKQRRPFSQFRLSDVVYPVDLNNPNEIQEFVDHSWLQYDPNNGDSTPSRVKRPQITPGRERPTLPTSRSAKVDNSFTIPVVARNIPG